ncbi:hypothetical protein ACYSNO_00680 [Enterococcus sp. LJL98]
MNDPIDRLSELAKEEKERRPFAKLDQMEKELNLDDAPDTEKEDSNVVPTDAKEKQLLDEQGIIELAASKQAKFNNQAPQ